MRPQLSLHHWLTSTGGCDRARMWKWAVLHTLLTWPSKDSVYCHTETLYCSCNGNSKAGDCDIVDLWFRPLSSSSTTGISPPSLAPCYCPHSVQNCTADIQLPISQVTFTTYSSCTAHHDNSRLTVTTGLKFLRLELVLLNAVSPAVLHTFYLQCFDAVGWAAGRASGL